MSDIEKLVEKQAIERMMFEYSYALDMNRPDTLAALFVEDCEVSYAPNFGATGMEAYKKTLEGIGSFFKGASLRFTAIRRSVRTGFSMASILIRW
jgi:ketosteroid isomerase-like protein